MQSGELFRVLVSPDDIRSTPLKQNAKLFDVSGHYSIKN